MKKQTILILFLLKIGVLSAQDTFQLAPPLLRYPTVFFTKSTSAELAFAESNTQIHYTLNNQNPTTSDPIYSQPIRIKKNFTTVKARVFGKNFQPSDVVEATFIKDGLPLKSAHFSQPNPKFTGSGAPTLMDNLGGIPIFSNKNWLGFQSDTVEIVVSLTKKEKVKSVLVNLLQDQNSWIFLPKKIDAFYFDEKTNSFQTFDNQLFTTEKSEKNGVCTPSVLSAKTPLKTDKIKLHIHLLNRIPDWHAGKGQKSWIFIDEIKVY